MRVVCIKAPRRAFVHVGDVLEYNGLLFVVMFRTYKEGEDTVPYRRAPIAISLQHANLHNYEFKPTDSGHGAWLQKGFIQARVERHPDWEGFPDQWSIQYKRRWPWVWWHPSGWTYWAHSYSREESETLMFKKFGVKKSDSKKL